MGKMFTVAKREYLERVRSRWFIVITLGVPALMAAIFAITIVMASRSARVEQRAAHRDSRRDRRRTRRPRRGESLLADSSLPARRTDSDRPRVQRVTLAALAKRNRRDGRGASAEATSSDTSC